MKRAAPMAVFARADVRAGLRAGLALVLAYGVSLGMEWNKPLWAGISVFVLAVAPVGPALQKAWLRLLGSLVGAGVAFAIVATFPQERWPFLISVAAWVGLCAFFMRRSPHPYAWNVAGFVTPIIAIGSGPPDGAAFFFTAVERLQETICGILSYTLFALLIRDPAPPRPAIPASWTECRQAILSLADVISATLASPEPTPLADYRKRQQAAATAIQSVPLSAAEPIGDRGQLRAIADALDRLWQSVEHAPATVRERAVSLWQGSRLKLEQALGPSPESPGPEAPEHARLEPIAERRAHKPGTSQQDEALLAITQRCLRTLDRLTGPLEAAADEPAGGRRPQPLKPSHHLEDDVIAGAQVTLTVLAGALLWIYLPDIPTGPTVVVLLAPISMVFCTNFGAPAYKLLTYVLQGVLIGGLLQVLVLTRLSGFSALASVLFLMAAGITIWKYKNGLARIVMPIVVIAVLGITNVQNFSFMAVLNNAMLWIIICLVITVVGELPFSSSNEAIFLRLYQRFVRLAGRMTIARPMLWGYGSALSAPSEMRGLLGKLNAKRLPIPVEELDELISRCEDCQFWLSTWWAFRPEDGERPIQPGPTDTTRPETAGSQTGKSLAASMTVLQSQLDQQQATGPGNGSPAVRERSDDQAVFAGSSWQLLWSLERLAHQDRSIPWANWPRPPLPWSGL
ncbi:hypothetical protein EVJ50_00765 [Synechococcus sp. RSCCF101]|uniref:FUSC family protein n=1 Tax=Synechococcus sp. RSCCF101 TaxID=2511069 RepID=UPI00124678DB|nr:FUSC family protein [Synechococcus sp. RSCCF101]QEY31002.1 hypothetical protein EVJ50_00765 [Synechococcus sp. RSCCF101]